MGKKSGKEPVTEREIQIRVWCPESKRMFFADLCRGCEFFGGYVNVKDYARGLFSPASKVSCNFDWREDKNLYE